MKVRIGFTIALFYSGVLISVQASQPDTSYVPPKSKKTVTSAPSRNVVKLNLWALFFKGINPAYERVFASQWSGGLSINYLPSIPLPGFVSSNLSDNGFKDARFTGYQLTPYVRYYTNKTKGAPRGFYLEPFIRIAGLKISTYYQKTNPQPDDAAYLTDGSTKARFGVQTFGAGLNIGWQWILKNNVTIDWNLIGIGLGYIRYYGEVKNDQHTFTSGDQNSIVTSVLDGYPGASFSSTPNSVKVSVLSPFPVIFRTGFSVGYAF